LYSGLLSSTLRVIAKNAMFKIAPGDFVSRIQSAISLFKSNAIKNRYASSLRVRSIPVFCLQVKYFKQNPGRSALL
jgi:hypothetical protein